MDDPAQQRSIPKYLPQPESERRGLGLCLSGGGYRVALFHLGSMRRLNELGIPAKITDISSVSGGSILAAHLATVLDPWPEAPIDDWDARVADPFKRFTNNNNRTGPVLKRLLPWNWARTSTAVEALGAKIRTDLDRFSDAEKSVLENHGYTLADAAVRKHATHLIDGDPAETAILHLHYMEEARVRSELADSHKLKLPFGRR
ncbi:MAG: patatin-like phospholipase family protein [Actinomycetota bacterium]